MSNFEIPKPEKLEFVGPAKKHPRVEKIRQYLDTRVPYMPDEVEHTPERKIQIEEIRSAFLDYGKNELGIDLSKRMPVAEKFHFSNSPKFKKEYGLGEDNLGCYTESGHLLIEERNIQEDTLSTTNHELIHLNSYRSVNLCELNNLVVKKGGHSGYINDKNFALAQLDEALTEITNIDIMANYWPKQKTLASIDINKLTNIGYLPQVILIDGLIKKIAQKQGKDYKEVLRHLQRGKFLGKMQALRIVTETIGKEGIKLLARLSSNPREAINFAERLGLIDVRKKLIAWNRGEEVTILESIIPNFKYKYREDIYRFINPMR